MRCVHEVETPVGAVAVALEVGTGACAVRTATTGLPSGAMLTRWWTDDGVEVRSLRVRCDEARDAGGTGPSVTAGWGVVWSVLTERATSGVSVSAMLPAGCVASPNNGECLEAAEMETPKWVVCVGGPDDDLLGQLVASGRLPASWQGLVGWDLPGSASSVARAGARGVTWTLPPLAPRDVVTTHVAVAWAPPGDEDDVSAWLAVDTSPTRLLALAGIAPSRPDRAGWDPVPRP